MIKYSYDNINDIYSFIESILEGKYEKEINIIKNEINQIAIDLTKINP